jgi:hypothetical protein
MPQPDPPRARGRLSRRLRRVLPAGVRPHALEERLARRRRTREEGLPALSRAQLERRVDALTQETARLRALAGERTDLSYLFVVTYGRSGSTLLQGLLSSTPGVMVRGENGGVLNALYRYHRTARRQRRMVAKEAPLSATHPWWGIDGYEDDVALARMRALVLDTVLRPGPDTRVVGFKELRWMPDRMSDYVAFLRELFPGARFVVNTRDHDEVAASKWWADDPRAHEKLAERERAFAAVLEQLGDDGYHVHFNDYRRDPSALRGLFAWLGEEYDEERLRRVMSVSHSY